MGKEFKEWNMILLLLLRVVRNRLGASDLTEYSSALRMLRTDVIRVIKAKSLFKGTELTNLGISAKGSYSLYL